MTYENEYEQRKKLVELLKEGKYNNFFKELGVSSEIIDNPSFSNAVSTMLQEYNYGDTHEFDWKLIEEDGVTCLKYTTANELSNNTEKEKRIACDGNVIKITDFITSTKAIDTMFNTQKYSETEICLGYDNEIVLLNKNTDVAIYLDDKTSQTVYSVVSERYASDGVQIGRSSYFCNSGERPVDYKIDRMQAKYDCNYYSREFEVNLERAKQKYAGALIPPTTSKIGSKGYSEAIRDIENPDILYVTNQTDEGYQRGYYSALNVEFNLSKIEQIPTATDTQKYGFSTKEEAIEKNSYLNDELLANEIEHQGIIRNQADINMLNRLKEVVAKRNTNTEENKTL